MGLALRGQARSLSQARTQVHLLQPLVARSASKTFPLSPHGGSSLKGAYKRHEQARINNGPAGDEQKQPAYGSGQGRTGAVKNSVGDRDAVAVPHIVAA